MDEIKWDAVQNGDLESLANALLSSSTLRRVRALQEVREKNGTLQQLHAHTQFG